MCICIQHRQRKSERMQTKLLSRYFWGLGLEEGRGTVSLYISVSLYTFSKTGLMNYSMMMVMVI